MVEEKMTSFKCTKRDGSELHITGKEGWSLMALLREAGADVEGTCGGSASCGTCHIHILSGHEVVLPPLSDEEDLMFDMMFHVEDSSRLACQIQWDNSLAGLRVAVAPKG